MQVRWPHGLRDVRTGLNKDQVDCLAAAGIELRQVPMAAAVATHTLTARRSTAARSANH